MRDTKDTKAGTDILRDVREFFRSHAETPDLRAAQRETILSRTLVLVWIAVFGMPTTCLAFVASLARSKLTSAIWMVSAAVLAVVLLRVAIRRGLFDRSYHLAMVLLVGGVFGPLASGVLEITRGSAGDFFFAFFMIFFSFTALYPAELGWILVTAATVVASFVLSRGGRSEGIVFDGTLVSGLIYLLELTFIGTVLNRVVYKLFFDEKRARIELNAANEGLRELDKAKSSFFSNISHEIRTPLTLILGPLTQILRTQKDHLAPDLYQKLSGIRGNANRLLRMVNSLLDFAKLEAGQAKVYLTSLKIRDVLANTTELFVSAAETKAVTVAMESDLGDLVVATDLDKLEKILVNLVGNALKFTPAGGRITLRGHAAGDHYELSVEDTGVGIPASDQAKVFERFTQLDTGQSVSVRGTGIGLSMVSEYAKLLGGSVSLKSAPGVGSTFTVRLPVAGPAMAAEAADGPSALSTTEKDEGAREDMRESATADLVLREEKLGQREVDKAGADHPRILVVDDNPALVALLVSILEGEYNLSLAADGSEALARLAAGSIDLVISDVMMPVMSGLELVRRIRADATSRHVPVILLTARGGSAEKVEGLDMGADDYIGKPFDPEELLARVRSLFELRKMMKSLALKTIELENALVKLKNEELKVIESEKLRTMGELAAGIFHELHNYMNMICNGAFPLKEGLDDLKRTLDAANPGVANDDLVDLVELVHTVHDAAQAARGVTGELKGYAHQDKSVIKPVDLNDVLRSTYRMFGKHDQVSIKLELSADPVIVQCPPTRLNQVFTNLMRNAIDATKGTAGAVTVSTAVESGTAVARVSDTGPGISEANRVKLFEPFFTTKKQGEGLGLGLSLSRKVMHDIGGDLRYDESYTTGARFVLTLPEFTGTSTKRSTTAPPPSL